MVKIQVEACKCNQCGNIWLPRKDNPDPIACSSCKSPFWNREKRK